MFRQDFVEVYLEDEGPESKKAADAAKELINRTLNRRNLYHYNRRHDNWFNSLLKWLE